MVTNIDPEHLDHWKTEEALRQGFVDFINRVPFYGLAILCLDHPTVQGLLPEVEKRYVTYGESHAGRLPRRARSRSPATPSTSTPPGGASRWGASRWPWWGATTCSTPWP